MKSLIVEDNFYPQAQKLRSHFLKVFSDPKKSSLNRFIWDYWHIPNQYTLLRTPASSFFPSKEFEKFTQFLLLWGQKNLGCSSISPPWLSAYVEGCEQRLHCDVPHGPWAYVFSLSPPRPLFKGGETVLAREETLTHWQNLSAQRDREEKDLIRKIKPRFNRLSIFDPRIPHGVERVTGVQDIRESRLVIHGWFTMPSPKLEGALSPKEVTEILDSFNRQVVNSMSESCNGLLLLKWRINKSGKISQIQFLTNNVRNSRGLVPKDLARVVMAEKAKILFPKKKQGSEITLPLIFS